MRKILSLFAVMLFLGVTQMWGANLTKTEGFETKAPSTTYNSTVTISEAESDCGIGWSIFYGAVSTNDKISGSNSAQMRYYSSSDNRGYVQSTTAVDGLSNVAFKARVSNVDMKLTVSCSADGSAWTALATNVAFEQAGAQGVKTLNYDIPSGGKYIKFEVAEGSTKPSSGNIKLIIDSVVFTYAEPVEPVVLPDTLDVSNVSFRSEGMPDYVITEGDTAGTYFDMGAHDSSNDTALYAEWDVTIQPVKYNIAVDVYNTNSWTVQILLLNQAGTVVKTLDYHGHSGDKGQFSAGSMDLRDLEAGDYKVRAHSIYAWSALKVKDIIFAADYQGVSVDLPGTLLPAYAELSAGASVANNAIAFAPATANTEYAIWNVSFAEAGNYNVSIDMTASNGHTYGVALLSADGATGIDTVAEAQAWDTGVKELGTITVPAAGNYQVKLTNATQWSEAVINSITIAAPIGGPVYYLVGTMNNWTPADEYKFEENPGAPGEYMLTAALTVGDEIKVKGIVGATETWYPAGTGNNYVVDADHAGEWKKIYFRPDGQGGEGWHYGVIYVEANPEPQGCDWDNIEFLEGPAEYANQFKVCKAGAQPNVQNIQVAPWADNNVGIYVNFPDAVIGEISLPEGQYKIEGAGVLLYLSAFTAKETEVTVQWQNGVYSFTVLNVNGTEPQPSDWAVIKFTKVVPKDSLAADASFVLFGSEFKAQITDTDNKMEIDANACRFGSAEGYDMFTHRLKSGGKSSSKNFITLTIPEDGKLAIAVRTGSNSATDRNLVIKQGNDTLFNQLILESQAIKIMEDTVEVSVYPYVSIPVEAGNVVLSYPVGSLNFYAFAFKPEPIPVYYMKNNWNEGQWLWREMTRNGLSYKLDSVVYGGNGVNYNTAESDEGATWVPDSMILGDKIAAKDTVSFVLNPIAKTVTANLVGKYVKPAGQLSCAEIYALADSAAVLMNGVVVTYVNGSNIFVKDETGAMLIYLPKNTSVAWKPGDILSNVRGIKVTYKGLVEVSPTQAQVAAVEAIAGYAPAPEELTFVNDSVDMNKYIIVKGIEFDADTAFVEGKNGTIKINLGNQALDLFNKFKLGYEFKTGKKYDIVAIVSYYNALQLYFVTAEEQATIAYYVAGSMNGWAANEAYMLTPNNESLYEGEFTFAANDEFKVIGFNGKTTTWYPDGMGNNFKITEAGDYKITFNPAGNVEGWYAGYFNVIMKEAPIDTIPTTAPAAPTQAEEDVMAIYCNHYTTNNLNFVISDFGGSAEDEDLDIQGTRVGYMRHMTWDCIIDPINTDSIHDLSGYKKLHVDFWAPAAAKIKFTAEAVAGGNYKDGVVLELAEGWTSWDIEIATWPGQYDFANLKCLVLEGYKTPEGESFEGNPLAFANIYFYDKKAEGFENIDASVKAVKVLQNGQIFILRGDKVYTVTGQPIAK